MKPLYLNFPIDETRKIGSGLSLAVSIISRIIYATLKVPLNNSKTCSNILDTTSLGWHKLK